ncbi:hypothetical protein [Streptomyces sp. NPDC056061]|uniref:hypothetical protein n=1 Tax=Streptomyces sp. NPDC056061 TaxID=3345700 RepID=UPI0035D540B9
MSEIDPNAPQLNEHGYPDATPVAEMATEHQVAYWKHHARKHEATAKAAPDAAELERLRASDEELKTRKAAELSDVERVQAEKATAEQAAATARADADAAVRRSLLLEVALSKGLTSDQAARLQGSTKEELEEDADALMGLFSTAPTDIPRRPPSGSGSDVGTGKTVDSGEARFKARNGGTT